MRARGVGEHPRRRLIARRAAIYGNRRAAIAIGLATMKEPFVSLRFTKMRGPRKSVTGNAARLWLINFRERDD